VRKHPSHTPSAVIRQTLMQGEATPPFCVEVVAVVIAIGAGTGMGMEAATMKVWSFD
jgi:hypothetical protein